jgi:hypothetical protein
LFAHFTLIRTCHVRSTEGALRLLELRRAARQEIPGPPSGRNLRVASSEVAQTNNYISSIGTKLHEAIEL